MAFGRPTLAEPISAGGEAATDTAIELAQRGRDGEAESSFRSQLQRQPHDPVLWHNFAVFLSAHKRAAEAAAHYRQALQLRPDYPEALRNFALLLTSQRRFNEALELLWQAVRLRPHDVPTLAALGNTLLSARRSPEAIGVLRQAARLAPTDAVVRNQLGLACFDAGRFAEAETTFLEALRLDSRLASAHNNLGSLYKAMGRSGEAFACFELALALDPDSTLAKWNRALALLSAGDYERGWQEYEWRWQRPETPPRRLPKPLWNGEPLAGQRILLHTEQGLGDTVQFIRYAALLKQRGAYVLFECPSPLAEVLKTAPGVDELIIEGAPIPPFDCHTPLMGLPRLFQTSLADVPVFEAYVQADPQRVERWRQVFTPHWQKGQWLVGLSWQGNPHHQWDHFRSVPLTLFEPLTLLPNIQLVSLQRGPGTEQIPTFQRLTNDALLVPTDGQQTTPEHLADTAAIMAHLDLVISVDSAPAHLAAALGKRTWTLLSSVADWRWMNDRPDSPWYPSMRLFRQKQFGAWDEVMHRVASYMDHEFGHGRRKGEGGHESSKG
jgi:Flp pilus assembly protein TadD